MLPTSNSTKCFLVRKSNFWTTHFVPNIYFQGESGKEEKRKKQTPLKTFLQHFYNLKNLHFSNILAYMDQVLTKNTSKCSASKTLSISTLLKIFRCALDSLIKKFEKWNFCKINIFARISATIFRNHSYTQFVLRYLFDICQI